MESDWLDVHVGFKVPSHDILEYCAAEDLPRTADVNSDDEISIELK
jgi:hypothetical protein